MAAWVPDRSRSVLLGQRDIFVEVRRHDFEIGGDDEELFRTAPRPDGYPPAAVPRRWCAATAVPDMMIDLRMVTSSLGSTAFAVSSSNRLNGSDFCDPSEAP